MHLLIDPGSRFKTWINGERKTVAWQTRQRRLIEPDDARDMLGVFPDGEQNDFIHSDTAD